MKRRERAADAAQQRPQHLLELGPLVDCLEVSVQLVGSSFIHAMAGSDGKRLLNATICGKTVQSAQARPRILRA